jgi:hypothetical protein
LSTWIFPLTLGNIPSSLKEGPTYWDGARCKTHKNWLKTSFEFCLCWKVCFFHL